MKQVLIVAGIVVLLSPVFYYIGFQVFYFFSLKKSNKEAMEQGCAQEKEEHFTGKVIRIHRYEYSDYMNENLFGLDIRTQDSNIIAYQFHLKENKELLATISIGDSIIKYAKENKFLVIKEGKQQRSFVTPSCK